MRVSPGAQVGAFFIAESDVSRIGVPRSMSRTQMSGASPSAGTMVTAARSPAQERLMSE